MLRSRSGSAGRSTSSTHPTSAPTAPSTTSTPEYVGSAARQGGAPCPTNAGAVTFPFAPQYDAAPHLQDLYCKFPPFGGALPPPRRAWCPRRDDSTSSQFSPTTTVSTSPSPSSRPPPPSPRTGPGLTSASCCPRELLKSAAPLVPTAWCPHTLESRPGAQAFFPLHTPEDVTHLRRVWMSWRTLPWTQPLSRDAAPGVPGVRTVRRRPSFRLSSADECHAQYFGEKIGAAGAPPPTHRVRTNPSHSPTLALP